MPSFGINSKRHLSNAHAKLQKVMNEAIKEFDFSIICSYRGKEEQEDAFKRKASKAHFGQSPHNFMPAKALDCVPYPLDWEDIGRFNKMCDVFQKVADKLGIEIVLGRSFSFKDYPHVELKGWKNGK